MAYIKTLSYLYHHHVFIFTNFSAIFCLCLYKRSCLSGTVCLGYQSIHTGDHPSQFSVCICRWADSAGMYQNFPLSFSVSENFICIIYAAKDAFYAQPLADLLSSIQSAIVFLIVLNPYLKRREEEAPVSEAEHITSSV